MKLLISLLASVLVLIACEKDSDQDPNQDGVNHQLSGRYIGTFSRSGMDTVTVTILFSQNGRFEGSSNREKYPAICGGNFSYDETSINFTDSCTWTADFDWTLILDGSYNITYQDARSVRIYRSNGTITDEYLIARAER
jgi:hypothetical protein